MAEILNSGSIEIKDTSIAFRLGEINAKLENNDCAHRDINKKLDEISNKITDMCADLGTVKGKSAAYGGVVGFIVSALVAFAGWFINHITK